MTTASSSSSGGGGGGARSGLYFEGTLTVEELGHLMFVLRYRDTVHTSFSDIALVSLSESAHEVVLEDVLVLFVPDACDFDLLQDCVSECRRIAALTLRLETLARDSYYANAYPNGEVSKDAQRDIVKMRDSYNAENAKHGNYAYHRVCRDLGLLPDPVIVNNGDEDAANDVADSGGRASKQQRRPHGSTSGKQPAGKALLGRADKAKDGLHDPQHMRCCYCSFYKVDKPGENYFIHPYVPVKFGGGPIFFCKGCILNWKDFRDNEAACDDLVLPGEVNEEICGLCSAKPNELVLCSTCQRSYCGACLERVLTGPEYAACLSEDAWSCMACANGCDEHALPRAMWVVAKLAPPGGKATAGRDSLHATLELQAAAAQAGQRQDRHSSQRAVVVTRGLPRSDDEDDDDDEEGEEDEMKERERERGRGRGRGGHDEEDGVSLASSAGPNRSSSSGRSSRKRSKAQSESPPGALSDRKYEVGAIVQAQYKKRRKAYTGYISAEAKDGTFTISYDDGQTEEGVERRYIHLTGQSMPQVDKQRSASFYFAQYVKHIERFAGSARDKTDTDDVCFLCKDGGDLVECDWCPNGDKYKGGRRGCKKVYHSYCLAIGDVLDDIDYICPRHFCDVCGGSKAGYACRYCPASHCPDCEDRLAAKYGSVDYLLLDKAAYPPTSKWEVDFIRSGGRLFVCQTCLLLVDKSKADPVNEFPRDLVRGEARQWPVEAGCEVGPNKMFKLEKLGKSGPGTQDWAPMRGGGGSGGGSGSARGGKSDGGAYEPAPAPSDPRRRRGPVSMAEHNQVCSEEYHKPYAQARKSGGRRGAIDGSADDAGAAPRRAALPPAGPAPAPRPKKPSGRTAPQICDLSETPPSTSGSGSGSGDAAHGTDEAGAGAGGEADALTRRRRSLLLEEEIGETGNIYDATQGDPPSKRKRG